MPLKRVAVNYQDLCSKGLVSDLKLAAVCDIKKVCRLPCDRCPNVWHMVDLQKVSLTGLKTQNMEIKQMNEGSALELNFSAENPIAWLNKYDIPYRVIPDKNDKCI